MRVSQFRQRESFHRSPRWPAVAIAVAILLLVQPTAHAAGFGALRVRSNLGQPLQAEIELINVTEEEGQHLAARLASPDAYQRAGLTYNPIVSTLRTSLVHQPDGSYVVRVRSAQPIGEPIVDILVDLGWGAGRLSRAYTFLLDPASSGSAIQNATPIQVPQAMTPKVSEPAPAPAATPRVRIAALAPQHAARPARQTARPRPAPATTDAAPGRTYTVRPGDSLYDIASNAAPGQDAASRNQMVLALYRSNPDAFIGGNINRLRVGSVLNMPPAGNTLVLTMSDGIGQTAGSAGSGSDADRSRPAPAAAAPVADDRALKAMESRVAELEKSLAEMQHQLALKNAELARAAASAPPMPAASAPAPQAETQSSAPAAQAQALAAPAAPIETAASASPPVTEASTPAAAPEQAPVAAVAQPRAPKASWLSSLPVVSLALGLVALLGGWVVYRRLQQTPVRTHGFQNSLLSRENTVIADANSLFGPAGAQNINTSQHSVFGTDFRVGSGNENNDVDPIAEADVYIAYGRDVQAEEILRETLEQHPERQAIRLKLMEIFANRQDAQGFQGIAEDMLARVGAASAEWAEAAALGRTFDPDNPLYLTVQGDGPNADAAAMPVAPAPPAEAADAAAAEPAEVPEAPEAPATADDLPRHSLELLATPDQDPAASAKVPRLPDLELLP
ncbi:type IV pilus assembly protein FimV [Ralstonia pseudosolanacearum]|uniref:type IV pilus assembly protein FimV n=1 Tax=Ralstonia pseudosolanacearum TaxID=1310165 RepID=UPI00267636BA|nr:FimV family protein [Ralstonia pseudosolanacearum]MDO3507392.1 FimV family protein [Ralstonia pseudosolanacearum]MDO3512788.1 FimV family protein [Ralstonia pseudosolanacearum]MDO3537166.1 FimV family protein [Ralstonia pseudosolanacearum]MDO3608295.1 FimV family protein [Ralstonia pseudosolanacearum]MDO3610832.1 FimV family protein [Ralstonia pseudosolanacearum]